jgi:hypothetical protein
MWRGAVLSPDGTGESQRGGTPRHRPQADRQFQAEIASPNANQLLERLAYAPSGHRGAW